jgi:D-lactate dehydrogenase
MKIVIYSEHQFEKPTFEAAARGRHELRWIKASLGLETAVFARDCECAAIFTSDDASGPVLARLRSAGIRYLALRSAGFNNVDLETARELGLRVARVPAYSPYAVAEHAVALMLALNRKLIRAHNRVRELNFSLDGLVGFDLHGKTAGIVGTGKIGAVLASILRGFGCRLLGCDSQPDPDMRARFDLRYVDLDELCAQSDIISLHVPLQPSTRYMIDGPRIAKMKRGVMLINTGRGALIDTRAVIDGLKTGHVGYLGLDVYEAEEGLFFQDHQDEILQDDTIARLMTFHNVLITSHQAFLTDTALRNIAETTMENITCWERGEAGPGELP